jgi:hypothetical protein
MTQKPTTVSTTDLAVIITESILATQPLNPADAVAFARHNNLPLWLVAASVEPNRRRAPWSRIDDQLLRDQLGVVLIEDIASALNRSVGEVDQRALHLHLSWQKLIAGRKDYSLPLAAWLLGVRGDRLSRWGQAGYLHIREQNGTRSIGRGELYRLFSFQEVTTHLDSARIVDPGLRQVYHARRDTLTRRPAGTPECRFTSTEDELLARGHGLGFGLDLLAKALNRTVRELKVRLAMLSVAEHVAGATLARRGDRILLSWKHSGLRPLVEAIVRYDAGQATTEDWRWVGRIFLTWLEFYEVPYPPLLLRALESTHAPRAVEAIRRLLCQVGLDPLAEQPPESVVPAHPLPQPIRDTYTWSGDEIAFVRRHWGLLSPTQVAAECTKILRRLTGDTGAYRNDVGVLNVVNRLGLDGRTNWLMGLTVSEAARLSGVCQFTIWDATEKGEVLVVGQGKYRYIPWADWFAWRKKHSAYKAKIAEVLASIGEETILKQEAMRLIDISETQITRYLVGGIIRAWKLPIGERGEWRVSLADALRVKEERESGKLTLETPQYEAIRQHSAEELKRLRDQGRIWKNRCESAWLPGYLTPYGVATEARIGIDRIRDDIRAGLLPAQALTRGRRITYAVAPEDTAAYIARIHGVSKADRLSVAARRKTIAIREQGLLPVEDVAARFGVSPAAVAQWARLGKLPAQQMGRRLAFAPGDVAQFHPPG